MSDFSGLPLVAGSIHGLRAWKQDRSGRLISPQQSYFEWSSGENVSDCKRKSLVQPPEEAPRSEVEKIIKEHYLPEGAELFEMFSERQASKRPANECLIRVTFRVKTDMVGHLGRDFPNKNYVPKAVEWTNDGYIASLSFFWKTLSQHMEGKKVLHDFENCSCGFYAYTETNHTLAGINYIRQNRDPYGYRIGPSGFSGIIEGYGTVTMGPYGFRAEKARILAMYLPDMIKVTEMSALFPDVLFFDTEKKMLDEFPLGVQDLAA